MTATIKIIKSTIKASYNPDPGDCLVIGQDNKGKWHPLLACSDMGTARHIASDFDTLLEELEAQKAEWKKFNLPAWKLPTYTFIGGPELCECGKAKLTNNTHCSICSGF